MLKFCTYSVENIHQLAELEYNQADIIMINFHQIVEFASYYEIPQAIKIARAISFETKKVITFCAKMKIEDDNFYSIAVFENGIFLGLSDAISEKGFMSGKCLKVYKTSVGRFGVCVGKDFLCPQTENTICANADFLLHQTFDKFGCEYICAVKGHAVFGTHFVGLYDDCAVKSDNRTECFENGEVFSLQKNEFSVCPPLAFLKLGRIE